MPIVAERVAALKTAVAAQPACKAALFVVGPAGSTEYVKNQRGAAVAQYLFGAANPVGDVAIFVDSSSMVVASTMPADKAAAPEGVTYIHVGNTEEAAAKIAAAASGECAVVQRELPLQTGSPLAEAVLAKVGTERLVHPAEPIVTAFLSVKDTAAYTVTRKAAAVCTAVFKRYGDEALTAQLTGEPGECSTLAEEFEKRLNAPNLLPGLETLTAAEYRAAYLPVVVQCKDYDLSKLLDGKGASDGKVEPNTIVVGFGCACQGMAAYMCRTFLVTSTATAAVKKAHSFVRDVSDYVLTLLKPGAVLATVYAKGLEYATTKDADLAKLLVPSFGCGTGLHLGDTVQRIDPRGTATVAGGMTFALRVALQGLDDGEGRTVSVAIGDTAGVNVAKGAAELFTNKLRDTAELTFDVGAVSEDDVPEYEAPVTRARAAAAEGVVTEDQELARQTRQAEIIAARRVEWEANGRSKPGAQNDDDRVTELGRLGRGDTRSYAANGDVPSEVQGGPTVFVDRKGETLWLPMGQKNVPFHAACIKKIELGSQGGVHSMVVQFHTTQQSNPAFARHRMKQWVKELTVTSTNGGALYNAKTAVQEIHQMISQRDAKRKAQHGVVQQDGLRVLPGATRLPQVKCRPLPATRGQAAEGTLEAHENGLRYIYGAARFDMLYDNVKHLIMQPAANDHMVVLHLALHKPILLNDKKKADHVQFIAEVISTSDNVVARRRTHDEELEAEDRDRKRVEDTNRQFAKFAQRVCDLSGLPVNLPFETMDFHAGNGRGMARFRGNERCLWCVNEAPFLTVTTDNVEIVAVERVVGGQQNFDAAFVHKDYKTVQHVTTIPMTELETFRGWLCDAGLPFFESQSNANWATLLKDIRADEEWEPWGEDGWLHMMGDGDEEEEEEEETDSDDDSDEDSEEDSDDSEFDSGFDSSEDDSDAASSDSGNSWDELERKAEVADRRRGDSDDDSDAPRRKAPRREGAARRR